MDFRSAAVIYGYSSSSTISKLFEQTKNDLKNAFVPTQLGPQAWNIKDIRARHIPRLCKALFPKAVGIIDGGYQECEKLSHFELQKLTYSTHKNYNLIKHLDIVLPDGRIYDTFGPFPSSASYNDEKIWNHIVESNEQNIKSIFETGQQKQNKNKQNVMFWQRNMGTLNKMSAML